MTERSDKYMLILRKYQLDIVFLFFALLVFMSLIFYYLGELGVDPHQFEWYVAGPLIALYAAYIWKIRKKINIAERRSLTSKTLVYWIVLGIILFADAQTPLGGKEYLSVYMLFIIFSLFLADSYWDFKKISLKSFWDRREK